MRRHSSLARLAQGTVSSRADDASRADEKGLFPKWLQLGLLQVALVSCLWPTDGFPTGRIAWLNIEQEGPLVRVEALCGGLDGESVSYELVLRKNGPSGQSRSAQSGDAYVAAGEEKSLARSATRLGPGDALRVELRVFKQGRIIADVQAQAEGRLTP